jgi:Family of unknown function (DUF6084)
MAVSSPVSAPALAFSVVDAAPVEHAAAPTLAFSVRVDAPGGEAIRSVLLDVQLQIAARRRRYDAAAEERLIELFGPVKDWGATLRNLLWTRATLVVPPFTGSTVVELPIACSYDMDVLATKYLDALAGGDVPLEFLFSGTVFYAGAVGQLQAARISWQEDAEFRLPVQVWRETMAHHFPGTAWLRLGKDSFDRLAAYKARNALPSWDAAVDELLEGR